MAAWCPECKAKTINTHQIDKPSNKKLECSRCGKEVNPCEGCGGTGCGDYPYPCNTCGGEGVKAKE